MAMKSTDVAQSRLLVVGGSGWIGQHVVRAACKLEAINRVIVAQRSRPDFLANLDYFEMNLSRPVVSLPHSDFLIYLAGSVPQSGGSFDGTWQTRALRETLELFFSNGGKGACILSSGSVYEGCEANPQDGYTEELWQPAHGVNATSDYGKIKQAEEKIAYEFRKNGERVLVGRLFACIGPGYSKGSTYAFVDFLRQARDFGKIKIDSPSSQRSYLWVEDLAEGLVSWVVSSESSQTVNLTGRDPISLKELAQNLAPEVEMVLGDRPPRDYFGNPRAMLSLPFFSDVMSTREAVQKMAKERSS